MGVGKTTFVKYLINSLQRMSKMNLTEVTSPTFNIMNEYNIGSLLIKHCDLYRLKSPDELEDLNLFDENDKAILLIEWPQIIKKKPNSVINFYFEYENEYQNRFIRIYN
jgi:tRNA threonylcarbamoyladenosine biosynthesis protein TsaE